MKHPVLFSSNRSEWYTPEHFVRRVTGLLDFIDLDPASNQTAQQIVRARTWCGPDHERVELRDGLKVDWSAYQNVYINPPYGRAMLSFARKIAFHARSMPVVALVPARVDTRWWHTLASVGHALVFIRGRLKFWSSDHTNLHAAPFPSAVFVYNVDYERVLEHFSDHLVYRSYN